MKKLLFLLFASLLVLGACGQKEESTSKEETTKKTESKDAKKETKKEDKTEKEDKETTEKSEPKTEEESTEENTTEEPQSVEEETVEEETVEEQTQEQQPVQEEVNTSNITDEVQLQNVLNGNFSEEQKVQAYNSAVSNGVIPQGTVSEGSAQAAYESSKGIQNGATKKDQMAERYQSWIDAGLMTEEEMEEELAKID